MSTDDGFEEDLRRRFDDVLDGVQPSVDLFQRTQARVQRRGASRLLTSVAAAALVVAGGVVAVNVLAPSGGPRIDPIASEPSEQPTVTPSDPSDDPADDASPQPSAQPTGQRADDSDGTTGTDETADTGEGEGPTIEGDLYTGPPIVEGAEMAVIGVEADDVLNVRAAPGTDNDVIATLGPLADDFAATGEGRMLDGAVWVEVDTGDVTGWVHAAFVAHAAGTADITSQVIEQHGSRPSAGTLVELAEIVAGHRATQEPSSQVVISDGPRSGDPADVTVDVVGFGDDSVRADRLVVFATPDDGSFTLRSVEATTYCSRGVTDEGICL